MRLDEIKAYQECVIEQLMKKYHLNELSARKLLRESYLPVALKMDAEETLHDPIEYWADMIYKESKEEKLLQM